VRSTNAHCAHAPSSESGLQPTGLGGANQPWLHPPKDHRCRARAAALCPAGAVGELPPNLGRPRDLCRPTFPALVLSTASSDFVQPNCVVLSLPQATRSHWFGFAAIVCWRATASMGPATWQGAQPKSAFYQSIAAQPNQRDRIAYMTASSGHFLSLKSDALTRRTVPGKKRGALPPARKPSFDLSIRMQ